MLVSLVVAVGLWLTFSMREAYTVDVDVALRVAGVPEGQALSAAPPAFARATLRGEGWKLLVLSRSAPVVPLYADGASVDLERAVAASGLPPGVDVQGVQPREVRLRLDRRVSRRLPIRLVSGVRPAPSFGLLRPPRLLPDSVTVTGAAGLVAGLRAWPTVRLDASDVRAPLTRTVALQDTLAGLLVPSVRTTTVQVPIAEFTEGVRSLAVRVVNVPAGIAGVRTEPSRVRATYRVPLTRDDLYERARTSSGFVAVVDYRDIARDTTSGTVPVAARVPAGLDVRDVALSPTRLEYFIVRRAAR
ncbi:MAG TPA: hypothetical protein VF576_09560 [Rubricoccaceae bacterium]|jgi:hypothetical protein